MFQRFIEGLRGHLQSLHRDQGGAVALMSLAACLILLMIGLVLYDTGKATREKLQLETAADTAAYTQAGIKARTMNMIAFTNITKRSIVTIQNVYVAAWAAYSAWYASRVAQCFKWLPNISACKDVIKNATTILKEGLGDWPKLAQIPVVPIVLNGTGAKKHQEELEQLTRYQEYITVLTPWWAYMAAVSAATRNGASFMGTFPHPPDPINSALNFLDTVSQFLRGTGLYPQTGHKGDYMPVQSANSVVETCVTDAWTLGATQDALYAVEYLFHIAEQARYSGKDAPRFAGAWLGTGMVHCLLGHLTSPMKVKDSSAFKYNTGARNGSPKPGSRNTGEKNWAQSNSNLVFVYKNVPANFKQARDKYKFIGKDYDNSMTRFEKSSGFWAMSAGEYVYLAGSGLFSSGPTPWHTGWTARLTPITRNNGGMLKSKYSFNAMYHDMLPYMGVGMLLGLLSGIDLGTAFDDLLYFEKATRAMDNGSLNGIYR